MTVIISTITSGYEDENHRIRAQVVGPDDPSLEDLEQEFRRLYEVPPRSTVGADEEDDTLYFRFAALADELPAAMRRQGYTDDELCGDFQAPSLTTCFVAWLCREKGFHEQEINEYNIPDF